MTLPTQGAGHIYHPAQCRQPPSERHLEHARAAAQVLERKPRQSALRRFNQLGLRRSARKGGRFGRA